MTRERVRPEPGIWKEAPVLNLPENGHRVMGIDASLTATGLAVINGTKLFSDVLSPPKDQNRGPARLSWFKDMFSVAIRTHHPELIFIEGYGFGAKNQAHSLGELGGILKVCIHESGVPFQIAPPTVLKMFATGKGNAEKDAVSKELFKRYGVDLMNNNAVDAAGLAIMALAAQDETFRKTLTQPQTRAMSKVSQ